MKFTRRFTTGDRPVADRVEWEVREASIPGAGFSMQVEVPKAWSQDATNVFAQKYLRKAGVPLPPLGLFMVEEDGVPNWLQPAKPAKEATLGAETSARQVFHRMAGCWTYWGWREGYFNLHDCKGSDDIYRSKHDEEKNARIFYDELYWMLAHQYAAPNSPQWFNTGLWWAYGIEGPDSGQWFNETVYALSITSDEPRSSTTQQRRIYNSYEHPQVHACYIQPVADTLVGEGGMLDLWAKEARLFKHGSGTGTNFSSLRAKGEALSGGGVSSGLMSFLRVGDSNAGSVKSGGVTRRAAKMVVLDVDHPEIEAFVDWKVEEEYKAAAMNIGSQVLRNHHTGVGDISKAVLLSVPDAVVDRMEHGFDAKILKIDGMEAEAIASVDGQNSNNSVRVPDKFLTTIYDDPDWHLTNRTDGRIRKVVSSLDLWRRICRAAWACGDPGLQFSDTINAWHTCPNDGEIRASNPCFTGDTLVWTAYGPRRFEDLAANGASIPVLTELADGTLAYRDMISPRMTKKQSKLIQITLKTARRGKYQNTSYLRCTPDHVFYLKDGNTRRAIDLKKNDRIESAYRKFCNNHSILIQSTSGDFALEHHLIAEYDYGRRPNYPLEHGHHIDEDHSNNVPGNVEILGAGKHLSHHKRGTKLSDRQKRQLSDFAKTRTGERNPFFGKTHSSEVRKMLSEIASRRTGVNNPFFGKNHTDVAREKMRRAWDRRRHRSENHVIVEVKTLDVEEPVYCGTVHQTGRFFISLGDQYKEGVLVSNCSEYLFIDSTACNLASLNLCKFLNNGQFNCDKFEHAVRLWTTVLDISVSMASYPSREIAEGSYLFRTLGLGYANLGGLLARMDLRYDSDAGRALAAGITALMTGAAYRTSAEIASELGPFPRWEANAEPMRRVIYNHSLALSAADDDNRYEGINVKPSTPWFTLSENFWDIYHRTCTIWDEIKRPETQFRNAQVTVLAPTGTIRLVMDCSTSGIEPFYTRRERKRLAGGGEMFFEYPGVLYEDCAVPSEPGGVCLEPLAHVKMVAAVQPFISGGVSKTVNLPHSATVEDVNRVYREAHRLGLKSVAVYRDGSKLTQPVSATSKEWQHADPDRRGPSSNGQDTRIASELQPANREMGVRVPQVSQALKRGARRELPSKRPATSRIKLEVAGQSIYLSTGDHEDGELAEIFLGIGKEGSGLRSWAECFCKAVSIGLQYGVPLGVFVDAFERTKFEPAGMVAGATRVRFCDSLPDLVFRHLAVEYLERDDLASIPREADAHAVAEAAAEIAPVLARATHTAPPVVMVADMCPNCGTYGRMRRAGPCITCTACGESNGGCG